MTPIEIPLDEAIRQFSDQTGLPQDVIRTAIYHRDIRLPAPQDERGHRWVLTEDLRTAIELFRQNRPAPPK